MSERENEDFRPSKRFKSSIGKNEFSRGINKDKDPMFEAGNYYLGPISQNYARSQILRCLAKKKGTEEYYLMKMLILDDSESSEKCSYVRRAAFHNEYTFLTLLKDNPGVIQICDFFKEYVHDNADNKQNKVKRICMVLECVVPHGNQDFEYVQLSHYLKKERLSEFEALYLFHNLLLVLQDLHEKNIAHTNLKNSSILLNLKSFNVKLIDFYCAKHVTTCKTSPLSKSDDCTGVPVSPKTCDMWSAGAVLYEMLKGCVPFGNTASHLPWTTSSSVRDLYFKIIRNDCIYSSNTFMSDGTKDLLRKILWEVPGSSIDVSEALDLVSNLLVYQFSSPNPKILGDFKSSNQVVPVCPNFDLIDEKVEKTQTPKEKSAIEPTTTTTTTGKSNKTTKSLTRFKETSDNGLNKEKIKYAMMRLGATSVNNIKALSFSYRKNNSNWS